MIYNLGYIIGAFLGSLTFVPFYFLSWVLLNRFVLKRLNVKLQKFDIWLVVISWFALNFINTLLKAWDSSTLIYAVDVLIIDILIFACDMFLLWLYHKE